MSDRDDTIRIKVDLYDRYPDTGYTFKAAARGSEIPRGEFERLIALPINSRARRVKATVVKAVVPDEPPEKPTKPLKEQDKTELVLACKKAGISDASHKWTRPQLIEALEKKVGKQDGLKKGAAKSARRPKAKGRGR